MSAVPDMTSVRANLAFTCSKEADRLPVLNPEADQLFKYARWLDKQPAANYDEIARYYRIAAAHGHYKANSNLQTIISEGRAASPNHSKETIALALQLIKDGIPGGYYDIGRYLEIGYGLKQDAEKSLIYYRKSADLGSPEGQYYVGDKLGAWDAAPKIARQMLQCAADQGHGNAADMLANDFRGGDKNYPEALRIFQKAVAAGNTLSALVLEEAFKAPPPSDELAYLALPEDLERSRRYKEIKLFLRRNESKNPKVPDIDQIVPLPPAKLPHWDGSFQWQKEQDAAVPPTKPDEKLVTRLANDKRLDPATGLLIPREPLGSKAETGAACPESGAWCYTDHRGTQQVSIIKGDPMPVITRYYPRSYAWMPGLIEDLLYNVLPKDLHRLSVTWKLTAYPETKKA